MRRRFLDHYLQLATEIKGARSIDELVFAEKTIATLVFVRDVYMAQLAGSIGQMNQLLDAPQAVQDARIQSLLRLSSEIVAVQKLYRDLNSPPIPSVQKPPPDATAIMRDTNIINSAVAAATAAGDTEEAAWWRSLDSQSGGFSNAVQQHLFSLYSQDPMLAISGLPQAFVQAGGMYGSNPNAVQALRPLLVDFAHQGIQQATKERVRVNGIDTVEGLTEFLGSQYQQTWSVAAGSLGPASQEAIELLLPIATSFAQYQQAQHEQTQLKVALAVTIVSGVVVVIAIPLTAVGAEAAAGGGLWAAATTAPEVGMVGGATETFLYNAGTLLLPTANLAGAGAQAYFDGSQWWVVSNQLSNAQAGATALGQQAVQDLHQAEQQAARATSNDFVFITMSTMDLVAASASMKAGSVASGRVSNTAAKGAGDIIPAGQVANASNVTDSGAILDRLDDFKPRAMPGGGTFTPNPRAGAYEHIPPGDKAFFMNNGLQPEKTVQVGGNTFHLSKPFTRPGFFNPKGDKEIFIIAFQEASDGKVIPRTFYLSGKRGVFRAAPAAELGGEGLLSKGPTKYTLGENGPEITWEEAAQNGGGFRGWVNQNSVDIAAEMQGPLSGWLEEAGINTDLAEEVADRAVFGHLELIDPEKSELGGFLSRQDAERRFVLTESNAPDYAAGPLDRWTTNSPVYGKVEGFTFKSKDGDVLYIVLRDGKGNVWVPSIQDATSIVTPLGTRAEVFDAAVINAKTGLDEGLMASPATRGAKGGYILGEVDNDLIQEFRQHLPPPGSQSVSLSSVRTRPGETLILEENPFAIGIRKDPVTGAAMGQQGVIQLMPVDEAAAESVTGALIKKPWEFTRLPNVAPTNIEPGNTAAIATQVANDLARSSGFGTWKVTTNPARGSVTFQSTGLPTNISITGQVINGVLVYTKQFAGDAGDNSNSAANALQTGPSTGSAHPSPLLPPSFRSAGFEPINEPNGETGSVQTELRNELGPGGSKVTSINTANGNVTVATDEKGQTIYFAASSSTRDYSVTWHANGQVDAFAKDDPKLWVHIDPPSIGGPRTYHLYHLDNNGKNAQLLNSGTLLPPSPGSTLNDYLTPAFLTPEKQKQLQADMGVIGQPAPVPVDPNTVPFTAPEGATPNSPTSFNNTSLPAPKTVAAASVSSTVATGATGSPASDQPVEVPELAWGQINQYIPGKVTQAVPLQADQGTTPQQTNLDTGEPNRVNVVSFCVQNRATCSGNANTDSAFQKEIVITITTNVSQQRNQTIISNSTQLASLNTTNATTLDPGTVLWAGPALPPATKDNSPALSIVANGTSSGDAFVMKMRDPSGLVKDVKVPEGTVLEPLKREAAKKLAGGADQAASAAAGRVLTQQVGAMCLEFAKLPPEAGMFYRVADQAVQGMYKPLLPLLRAARELVAGGKLHPDSDPQAYATSITQYAIWSELGNWDQQKFTEMMIERTRKNAEASNVKWTKEMEKALLGVAPNRWSDVVQIQRYAQKLSQRSVAGSP